MKSPECSPTVVVNSLTRVFHSRKGALGGRRHTVTALKGVSFEVAAGELFGLLGPNGAGKTTTVKILTTLLAPTGGEARVLGLEVFRQARRLRPRISFVFGGERGLYWRLTGRQNLRYFSDLYGVPRSVQKDRLERVLSWVGLADRADEPVETYSRGMKQRLHIARALVNDPDVIFLDEPTIGLDPVGAVEVRQLIDELARQEGKTVFLTTHYMFEADALCSRVAIINHGEIVALDTPSALKRVVAGVSVINVEAFGLRPEDVGAVRNLPGVFACSLETAGQRQHLTVQVATGSNLLPQVLAALPEGRVGHVAVREPTLEDAYITLVGDRK